MFGVICDFSLSASDISLGDELVSVEAEGWKAGTPAPMTLLGWVTLMVGVGAGVSGDEEVAVDGDVESRVPVAVWPGGVVGPELDAGSEASVGFSCLMGDWEVEDRARGEKLSSVSGLTSLTAEFLFLVRVLGTSKKDICEVLLSLDGVEKSARLATDGPAVGVVCGT